MSRRTRFAVWMVRAALLAALGLELLALHFPAPSGVHDSAQEDVRGAWTLGGRVLRAGAALVPDVVKRGVEPFVDDKTVHFLLFLPLGLLFALERRLHGPLSLRGAAFLLGGLALYAALGEASQVLGGRIVDVGDFIANVLGAVVGVLAITLMTRPARGERHAATAR